MVLYTRGKRGDISKELRQFLTYMENTVSDNAVNDDLKDIQKMVEAVKRDGEVSLRYMKSFEHDQAMFEQGRMAEMENTEREKKRAEEAERNAEEAEKNVRRERKLTKHLLADKRYEDMERAINDKEFWKSLLKEYGIE